MARLKLRVPHAQSNNVLLRRVCVWGGLIAWLRLLERDVGT